MIIEYLKYFLFQQNIKFTTNLIKNRFSRIIHKKGIDINILTPEESFKYLKKTNKSLIRWGDADSMLFYHGNVYYQHYKKGLTENYLKILKNYNDKSPYLLAIPSKIKMSNEELGNELKYWALTKELFRKHKNKNSTYGDSLLFYSRKISLKDMETLWIDSKHIILIHFNNDVYKYFIKKYPKKKTFFIKIPEHNSYDFYEAYKTQVEDYIKSENIQKKDLKIIICAGSLARIFGYEFSKKYVVYDLGTLLGNTEFEKKNISEQKGNYFEEPK